MPHEETLVLDRIRDRMEHDARQRYLWGRDVMSLPTTVERGYGLGPDDGEALWFPGALGVIKADAGTTAGRFFAMEFRATKGFASPLHLHPDADEFFLVMSGELRVQHGEDIFEAGPGSLIYGPRQVPHALYVDSDEAKMLLILSPSGMEGFFRGLGSPAEALELPPPGGQLPDREVLQELGARYGQEVVGPPLPPKD